MGNGEDIKSACRQEGVPPSTFRTWAARDVGGIAEQFERAQGILALFREDEMSGVVEAGGRRARRQMAWRMAFADRWLPKRLRPGGK